MNRRHLLAFAPLALAACAGTTPATITTDVTAGEAAATAITGIVTVLQGVSTTGLTQAQVTALGIAVGQLQQVAQTLSAASQPAAVASAATTVNGVLTDIAAFLPDLTALLPLLSLVGIEPAHEPMETVPLYEVTMVSGAPDFAALASTTTPVAHMTAAQIAAMKARIAALLAAAAKAKAGN